MWLLVPFAVVFPGIMSLQLYGDTFTTADQAYPTLIRNLIPLGLRGFIFAALSGAVISSLASMLNSAATIFTIDLYKGFWKKDASEKQLIALGRIMTIVFVLTGCFIAPHLNDPRFGGVFKYIQEFQGYISPGILAAFVFGFVIKKAPPSAGVTALLLCVPVYGFLQWQFGEIAFLNRMAITFLIVVGVMSFITWKWPLVKPLVMKKKNDYSLKPSRRVITLAILIICGVFSLYAVYW
jgi:SSS family solute:Na+ symporter